MNRKANQMVTDGVAVVRSLSAVRSKYSKEEREVFIATQRALEQAAEHVKVLDLAVQEATARVTLADDALDAACRDLATALASEGFDRFNPFKSFGVNAPSALTGLNLLTQTSAASMLAKRVAGHEEARAGSRKAAAAVSMKAQAALDAEATRSDVALQRALSIARRDKTLPVEWQAALTALRAAVRYGDLKEKTSHYTAVFSSLNKPRAKKKTTSDEPVA